MRSRFLGLILAALLVGGCGGPDAGDPEPVLVPSEPFGLGWIQLVAPDGRRTPLQVYVADRPETRRLGLMHREHLPERAGMVFLFPAEHRGGFWMRNTLIPLSIAFFGASGEVLAVLDMNPCAADPCPVHDPGTAYHGALEVNQGMFEDVGLEPGWIIDLEE